MKNLLNFCFLLLTCTSCGCKKEEVRPEVVRVIFEIPLTITPIREKVRVGDTLWLEASFPDTIRDHNSGKYYKVPPSFDLRTRVGLFELIFPEKLLSEQPGFIPNFKVLNQKGGIMNTGATFGGVEFAHGGNTYSLKVGLIPNKRGIASLSFHTSWIGGGVYEDDPDLSFIDLGRTPNGGKRIPTLRNIYYIINEGNTHFDLFQRYCRAASLINPIEQNIFYEQKGTYTFMIE